MEEVCRVVGQGKAIPQDELLIALVTIVTVQDLTLRTSGILLATASYGSHRTMQQSIGHVTSQAHGRNLVDAITH